MNIKKAYEITGAKILFVSLVDKAANKKAFLLKKEQDGEAAFTTYGRIIKADKEHHYVTGIVYEPLEEDSHGNYMTEEEIIKAAYYFAKNGSGVDLQHNFEKLKSATIVETWVAKADFDIDGQTVKKGSWLMTVEVSDPDVWKAIEKGQITGFSMGGTGYHSTEDVELNEEVEKQEKKGLLKKLAKALGVSAGVIEKGELADKYAKRLKQEKFWSALSVLEDMLEHYDPYSEKRVYVEDETKVREALEDFNAILTEILLGEQPVVKMLFEGRPVEKAGKKMSCKNKETLAAIYESLGAFVKEFDDPDENQEEEEKLTKSEVEQIVKAEIEKAKTAQPPVDETEDGKDKKAEEDVKKAEEPEALTKETVRKMVEAEIAKALAPNEPQLTAEQVSEMITKAVNEAVAPILESRGLPSNLDNVIKGVENVHYLHGIL